MTDEGAQHTETDGGVARGDIYATEEEGKKYRDSVYEPLDDESLEQAPATSEYPKTDGQGGFRIADLPKVPKISHIVGPSAIMLGASLGSGETMFWPTIVAEGSWGLYWAFWVGVITQFFINTELQRWAIATGESIFQGFNRLHGIWPLFFLVFGFFQLGWPGWAATGSEIFAAWTGVVPRSEWWIIGVISMAVIWLTYQVGPLMYNVIERAQIVMMVLAILIAIVLLFTLNTFGQFANVPLGAVNFGALPSDADFDIATFLGGLAYAGAGGYTNLAQGVWAREKGYGMGAYQGRIKNPLRGNEEPEDQDGSYTFEPTDTNMKRWRAWWKVTQREHFLTFVVGVMVVATILMSVSAKFAGGGEFGGNGVTMWLDTIIPSVGSISAWLLYALLFIALFSTQYAQIEVFVRNSSDIVYQKIGRKRGWNMSRIFFGLLTIFTLWGMAIIGFQVAEPWIILVIGAAAAGVMMWPYNALTVILNTTRMPEHTQPGWARIVAMWWATAFFGYFSILLIGETLVTRFGLDAFGTTVAVMGSGVGGYVLWAIALVVQIYTMYRSARAKLDASGTVDDADEASGFLA
ncbi:MAG TPA: Nramp family divalent metal transporter [Halococcus sp.]|nr:Nramp family divalent metal transporter [Halococcus sp.]